MGVPGKALLGWRQQKGDSTGSVGWVPKERSGRVLRRPRLKRVMSKCVGVGFSFVLFFFFFGGGWLVHLKVNGSCFFLSCMSN